MTQPMPTQASDLPSKTALDTPSDTSANAPTAKKSKSTVASVSETKAPKRANSAFILFSQDERANLKRDQPTLSNTELFAQLGGRWRDADSETKSRYEALYQANKAKADEARKAFEVANGASTPPTTTDAKAKKKAVDPNAPKRANSAFILFSQDERATIKSNHPEATNAELFKMLGGRWRDADATIKAKYEAIYQANKAKADGEIREYAKSSKAIVTTDAKAKTPKKAPADPNAPKRSGSAFILFSKDERVNIQRDQPQASGAELFKMIGGRWREASAETKAKYEAIYKANKTNAGDTPVPTASEPTIASIVASTVTDTVPVERTPEPVIALVDMQPIASKTIATTKPQKARKPKLDASRTEITIV
jgi:hypothetical protein